MRKFAESYPTSIIQNYTLIKQQLKNKNTLTQQSVIALLNADKQQIEIVQQPVAQLAESLFLQSILARVSWSHHVVLMDKESHIGKRLWYMLNTLEHGISRNILAMQIESRLFERQIKAKKINNFERTLPQPQTDFANYLLKEPYIFDFVQAKEKADERNIEEQLANHITKF